MKALHFVCPTCEEPVKPYCAIWEGGELRLVANCETCGEEAIRFSCDKFAMRLLGNNPNQGIERVH